jgi:pimeloyl-ACP methyl ester carboxylesterase
VDADVYWPSQKPPTEARLLVFGYSSDVISFCGTESDKPSFLGIARDLVKGLLDLRRHSPLRPLIFVGHSLGGYIIKEVFQIRHYWLHISY